MPSEVTKEEMPIGPKGIMEVDESRGEELTIYREMAKSSCYLHPQSNSIFFNRAVQKYCYVKHKKQAFLFSDGEIVDHLPLGQQLH